MSKDARTELRRVVAQLAALTKRRDELICEALASKSAKASELAEDAGLSVQRIYQIRDGVR